MAQMQQRASFDLFWAVLLWVGALVAGATFAVVIGRIAGAGAGAGLFFGIIIFIAVGAFLAAFAGKPLPPPNTVVAPTVPRSGSRANQARPGKPPEFPQTPGGEVARAAHHASEAVRALGSAASRAVEEVTARATSKAKSVTISARPSDEVAAPPVSPAEPETGEGTRPAALAQPREGGPDDLKKIKGVGPKLEELLHSLGFYHFDQIAAWTPAELGWVDENLEGFHGRASRDDWVGQAKILATGGETDFSQRVDKGDVY